DLDSDIHPYPNVYPDPNLDSHADADPDAHLNSHTDAHSAPSAHRDPHPAACAGERRALD
ncbi:MAG: hypothetical protein ACPLYD_11795, partial [Anaerolineae bacterium]